MLDRKRCFSSAPVISLAALAVAVALGVSACGGGSGGSRGSGGSTGTATGGSTGTATGGSSGTGTGGTSGGGYPCNAVTATSPYITDFSDWTGSKWGKDMLKGGVFTYQGTGSTITAVGDTTSLKVMGTVMNYAGFGMYFDSCTNASAYSGVQFTIGGTGLGGCALELQVQTNSTKAPETSSMKGSCTVTPCTSGAAKMLTVTPGTPNTVKWTDLMGAAPAFMPSDIVALQWQVTTAMSCTPNFTVDDIKFVP